ncbi:hypothetical protein [Pelagibius sp.]|uniref:hypothetical protein n=1 Tax=Pelagibius sp. TaxID=1931238 RepID=UPI003BAF6CEB
MPVADTVETYRLNATAKSVSDKLVDGSLIKVTDTEITAGATMELESVLVDGVPDGGATLGPTQIEIKPADGITLDGEAAAVLRVMRVPRAGVAVAWKLIVRN